MPSLRSINKEAGTNFRRWKEVTAVVKEAYGNTTGPLPEAKPTPIPEVPEAEPEPDFPPRITNRRVEWQMRGAGYQIEDGYPVRCPNGGKDFQTGEATWKFDDNGELRVAWEPTTNEEHRVVQYGALVDQPLVRAGDGSLDPSMFKTHHGWINFLTEYREKKLEAVRNTPAHVAAKQVAWFEAGVVIYRTTIGALLAQSLNLQG